MVTTLYPLQTDGSLDTRLLFFIYTCASLPRSWFSFSAAYRCCGNVSGSSSLLSVSLTSSLCLSNCLCISLSYILFFILGRSVSPAGSLPPFALYCCFFCISFSISFWLSYCLCVDKSPCMYYSLTHSLYTYRTSTSCPLLFYFSLSTCLSNYPTIYCIYT